MMILELALILHAMNSPLLSGGEGQGSYTTGRYRNLFHEIGKTDVEITAKLDAVWKQMFYGDDATQRIYYPVGADMAYIKDVGNNDVRTEGMSYGMMIAVQLDHREEFARLWNWAKTHMQFADGPWKGYFAWQCDETGKKKGRSPASDGEEYFTMALFFAANRWNMPAYRAEADAILHAMLHKEEDNGGIVDTAHNMFDRKEKQVVFVPNGDAATFTDPSYHLPAFYDLWSRWAKGDKEFWRDAAATSRAFFKKAAHPVTGLFPDYAKFDGTPTTAPWDKENHSNNFLFDAFRVGGNIGMDYAWFRIDPWQVEQSNRMLNFFAAQKPKYVSNYTVDGKPLVAFQSGGLVAMNAVAGLAADPKVARPFIQALWDMPIPSGQWRYYDGLLYVFGMMHASGQYRIWPPKNE